LVEEIIIVVIKVSAVTLIKSIIYVKEFDCTLENCIPSKVKSSVTEIKKIIAANYTPAKLNQWANAVYKDYKFDTADDFLAYVKKTVTNSFR